MRTSPTNSYTGVYMVTRYTARTPPFHAYGRFTGQCQNNQPQTGVFCWSRFEGLVSPFPPLYSFSTYTRIETIAVLQTFIYSPAGITSSISYIQQHVQGPNLCRTHLSSSIWRRLSSFVYPPYRSTARPEERRKSAGM